MQIFSQIRLTSVLSSLSKLCSFSGETYQCIAFRIYAMFFSSMTFFFGFRRGKYQFICNQHRLLEYKQISDKLQGKLVLPQDACEKKFDNNVFGSSLHIEHAVQNLRQRWETVQVIKSLTPVLVLGCGQLSSPPLRLPCLPHIWTSRWESPGASSLAPLGHPSHVRPGQCAGGLTQPHR